MKAPLTISKPLLLVMLFLATVLAVGLVNFFIIKYSGTPVPAPVIPRAAEKYGAHGSKPLTYVVLGDSTTIAQGGDYDRGYARMTARELADQGQGNTVTFYNRGVSGATTADVANKQVPGAVRLHPDVVLIAVGANDVTHLTSVDSVRGSLEKTIVSLRAGNPDVRIVVTGSPQMGVVPRFPEPARSLARLQTGRINRMVEELATTEKVTFAPIARETGPIFAAHREYYAADHFHPNAAGYAVWTPVLERALTQALAN